MLRKIGKNNLKGIQIDVLSAFSVTYFSVLIKLHQFPAISPLDLGDSPPGLQVLRSLPMVLTNKKPHGYPAVKEHCAMFFPLLERSVFCLGERKERMEGKGRDGGRPFVCIGTRIHSLQVSHQFQMPTKHRRVFCKLWTDSDEAYREKLYSHIDQCKIQKRECVILFIKANMLDTKHGARKCILQLNFTV